MSSKQLAPLDCHAALKQAEPLLRRGTIDGAIDACVRVIDEHPHDLEHLRALAILIGVERDAGGHRDVRGRIGRLARVQPGSPRR